MKYDPSTTYITKYPNDIKTQSVSFLSDMDTGATLASCVITLTNDAGTDLTSSMISSTSLSSPSFSFVLKGGIEETSYTIQLIGTTSGSKAYTKYVNLDVFGDIILNSKLGDPSANSYITVTQANEFIRNRYGHPNAWDALTMNAKKRVLIESTRRFENFNFVDNKYYDAQALAFPRDSHDVITGNCATPLTLSSFKNTSLKSDTYNIYPANYWKYGSVHVTAATPLGEIKLIDSSATSGIITTDSNYSATPTANSEFIVFAPIHKSIRDAQCIQAMDIVNRSGDDSLSDLQSKGIRRYQLGQGEVEFFPSGGSDVAVPSEVKRLLSRWLRKSIKIARG